MNIRHIDANDVNGSPRRAEEGKSYDGLADQGGQFQKCWCTNWYEVGVGILTYLKGVFMRLIFGLSESSKSKHVVKGEATVDVLGMCIYASLCL